ncbi:MAG TPA: hypothetical protein PLE92_00425 [Lentisphaeria bacterium]|nr:hypothetical protein [Lentisphaeria bacterium]
MRNHVFLLGLILLCLSLPAQDAGLPDEPWFDHVTTPSVVPVSKIQDFCLEAHRLLAAKASAATLGQLAPVDQTPRVLFLSIGGEEWPARTYFGAGFSFRAAWESLVDIMLANEPLYGEKTAAQAKGMIETAIKEKRPVPAALTARQQNPLAWKWLRLDIVQAALPIANFSVEHSRLALTSLVGLAFVPQLGFAFTPEQLTGRCLLESTRHLDKQQVGNLISETFNWNALKAWQQISGIDSGHRVCLFETDSYYCDGKSVVRLFRGHPIAKTMTAADCLEAAASAGAKIAAALHPRTGVMQVPFPEWVSSTAQDAEALDAQAEIAFALARLAHVANNPQMAAAAKLAMQPVLAAGLRFGPQRAYGAIVEAEELPPESPLAPRRVAHLRTNAMACLALAELEQATGDRRQRGTLIALADQLKRQALPGGGFIFTVMPQSGQLVDSSSLSLHGKAEAEALATLALLRAGTLATRSDLLNLADQNLEYLLARVSKMPLESLPNTPWLVEVLSLHVLRNQEFASQMDRLGFAASVDVETKPLYPDMYGSVRLWPSATVSAERAWLLASLSKWFRTGGETKKASDFMAAAAPPLVFQMQARMVPASCSGLPRPGHYVDFFRDHLEDFGFDLSGQATQIISLTTLFQELQDGYDGAFPGLDKVTEQLAAAQESLGKHPLVLSPELVRTQVDATRVSRDLTGDITGGATKTVIKTQKPAKSRSGGVMPKKRRQ